jgi:hypothetical protein
MSKEYVQRRLAEISKEPKRKIVRAKNNKTVVVTVPPPSPPVVEVFDMICYGDDRYEEAISRWLVWYEEISGEFGGDYSYIYMAHDEHDERVKVGYTTDPYHRLANLNTSYPGKLEFLVLFPMPKTDGYVAEKKIHQLLEPYKCPGKTEWFYKKGLRENPNEIMDIILRTNPHARLREYYDIVGTPIDFSYDENEKECWFWTVDVGQWEEEPVDG